jgi:hypothetical protein
MDSRSAEDFTSAVVVAPRGLGRNFLRGEDRQGHNPVAILSDDLWRRDFGGKSEVIGRSITLD